MAYTNLFPSTNGSLKHLKGDSLGNSFFGKNYRAVVHRFTVGDVDDPILYAAEPIYKWQQTDSGKWITANAIDIEWHSQANISLYGTDFVIVATLSEPDYTFFLMKFA